MDFFEDEKFLCLYEFEETPKISNYLYAICAGPYSIIEGKRNENPP